MNGIGECMTDTRYGPKSIRTRSQVGLGSEVLEGVSLLGNRIGFGIIDLANNSNG